MPPPTRCSDPAAPKRRLPSSGPILIALFLLAACLIVDPLRDFNPQDDGWAYARSVQRLLADGRYRLDAWSAANNPVQVYLAAGLSAVFGYGHALLRLSTLALLALALLSLRALLRELDVPPRLATALTLVLLANPLVLPLGFSFMSDVPFAGWLCAALWLYVRGIRRGSDATVLLGALAGAGAIGTRQFGLALIPGLLAGWLLASAEARPPWRRLALALAPPLAAAAWQLHTGLEAPNATQAARLASQRYYVTLPPWPLAKELAWRIATLARYLGFSMLAAVPLLLPVAFSRQRRPVRAWAALAACALFLAVFMGRGSAVSARGPGALPLPLWWLLPNAAWNHERLMWLLDRAGLGVALLSAWVLLSLRWRLPAPRRPAGLLLAATGIALLGLHLAYVQLNDTYVVALLPFGLLPVALALRRTGVPRAAETASLVASAVLVVAGAAWLRGESNLEQAQWQAGDRLLAAGVAPECIAGSRHWNEYHGAFDRWLAANPNGLEEARRRATGGDHLHDPFYAWMDSHAGHPPYVVATPWLATPPPGWSVLETLPYRDAWLRPRGVQVFAAPGARPPAMPGCVR